MRSPLYALVPLGLVALIAKHPVAGMALLTLIALWPIIKFAGRYFFEGFFVALGIGASGALKQIRPPEPSLRDAWVRRNGRLRGR